MKQRPGEASSTILYLLWAGRQVRLASLTQHSKVDPVLRTDPYSPLRVAHFLDGNVGIPAGARNEKGGVWEQQQTGQPNRMLGRQNTM